MPQPHPYARHVAALLMDEGFLGVQLERPERKALARVRGRPEIPFDISYWTPRMPVREYVECKYRTEQADERDVAKFMADLDTCGLPRWRGLVVTNKGYTPLALDHARAGGMRLYVVDADGHDLPDASLRGRYLQRFRRTLDMFITGVRYPKRFKRIV